MASYFMIWTNCVLDLVIRMSDNERKGNNQNCNAQANQIALITTT